MGLMAIQYLNVPYKWGANGPFYFDCSGLALKVLHDVGITLPDMTANDLYEYCLENGSESSMACDSLLFFGDNDKITHVGISLGEINGQHYMINAAGAGSDSLNMNLDELAVRDARVRIEKVNRRRDLIASIYLPYKE